MTICFGGNTNLWIQFIVLLTLRMCVLAISSRKINHLQIMIFVFIAWYWTSLNMILDVDCCLWYIRWEMVFCIM